MNWSLLAMMLLVFLIILIITTTVILFIRHWANRSSANHGDLTEYEGQYFVRYVPQTVQSLEHDALPAKRRSLRKPTQYVLSFLLATGLIGTLSMATYANRDKLAATIDLTEQELAAITAKEHRWEYRDFQQLPDLDTHLAPLRENDRGILLIDSASSEAWPKHLGNLAGQAQLHWEQFATRHQLNSTTCALENLQKCRKKRQDWIHVLLPGLWDNKVTQELLQEDTQIIAYGPPQQIFINKNRPHRLKNLVFNHGMNPKATDLSIVGDKALTLGFDAGMIMRLKPAFPDYHAKSDNAQAISISTRHLAGGRKDTRLYATAQSNKGRLVWMDFSPDKNDHQHLPDYYFDALLGSIFRYLGKKPYSAWATWPEGKQFAALLEEDTEDQYQNARNVANYFKEKGYPITWYVLSNEALNNRELTRLLAETGEIACHGDNHMDFPLQDLKTQQQRIARCQKVIKEITGRAVISFRPPREEHNTDTLNAMFNNGIQQFIAKVSGDRFTPAIYGIEGYDTALISIPRMNTDDYMLWGRLRLSDKESLSHLKQEMDWIKNIGGLFMFSFHTQYMNGFNHLNTVKQLADHIHVSEAYFATTRDIADWWRFRTQLNLGHPTNPEHLDKYQPVLLSVDEQGSLRRKSITSSQELALLNDKEQQ